MWDIYYDLREIWKMMYKQTFTVKTVKRIKTFKSQYHTKPVYVLRQPKNRNGCGRKGYTK